MTQITQKQLKEWIKYDPDTGEFFWIKHGNVGRPCGYNHEGYRRIKIEGTVYRMHRLAFLYMTGGQPNWVDHIDGNGLNNKWSNLRSGDNGINQQNIKSARSDNKSSKLLGVSYHKTSKAYQARIHKDGKNLYLGSFKTAEEAHAAYIKTRRIIYEGNTI